MVSDFLVPSIHEAPRVKDFNSRYSLHGRGENALVTALKRGQTSAFNELWQSHSTRLYWTTFRTTRNLQHAEDALQGALLNAFVHLQTFDGRSSFPTWLTRIAINSALMIVRKNGPHCTCPWTTPEMAAGRPGRELFLTLLFVPRPAVLSANAKPFWRTPPAGCDRTFVRHSFCQSWKNTLERKQRR